MEEKITEVERLGTEWLKCWKCHLGKTEIRAIVPKIEMLRQVHLGLSFPNSSSFSLKSMSFHNFLLFKNLQYLVINLRIKTKIYNMIIIISSFLSCKFHNSLSLEKPFLHSWIRLDFCYFHSSLFFFFQSTSKTSHSCISH